MALLMAGDFDGAAAWVVPAQQGILQALALGGTSEDRAGLSGRVRVGRVRATGKRTATVTFLGKLCRHVPVGGNGKTGSECISNTDPNAIDPYFVLHLIKTPDTGWKILFQEPNVDK